MMDRTICIGVLALALFSSASSPARGQDGFGPRKRQAEQQRWAEQESKLDLETGVVLPTRRCGNYFIVDAMINGEGPFAMLLDTGASVTALSPQAARSAGVRGRIDELRIGEVRFSGNIRCITHDLSALNSALGERFDGIVGHPVFQKVLLTYDYPASEVRIRTGELRDDMPGVAPMQRGKRPFIGAMIDGRRTQVLLDTGFTGSLSLTGFDRLPLIAGPVPVGGRLGIDGLRADHAGRLDGDVRFGFFTMRDPIVQSGEGDSLFGQGVLRDFVLTVDQQRGRVQVVRPDGAAAEFVESTEPLTGIGLLLDKQADRMVVLEVFADSPASAAGLRKGDAILAVDGVPIAERGCLPARSEPPRARRYAVQREGETFEVDLTAAVLVQ